MEAECGSYEDIESWMELVQTVRWNFPGLESQTDLDDHRNTILRFMGERRALCVKEHGNVIGVLLLSKKHNMICCLAVAPGYRRRGIACALMEKALLELDRSRNITVTTFRESDEKGTAPRALYQKYGFEAGKLLTEYDYPLQEFVLRGRVSMGEADFSSHTKP